MTGTLEGRGVMVTATDELAVAVDAEGPLPISPTDVAQFIRLEQCERYLRLRLHERSADRNFMRRYDVTPQSIPELLTRSGARFEERIEAAVRARYGDRAVNFATAFPRPKGWADDNARVLDAVRALPAGETAILFQPRLLVALDGWRLRGDLDILRLERDTDGALRALIADMKSSTSVKVEHRLQVAFYHAMLARLLAEAGIACGEIALAVLYRGPAEAAAAQPVGREEAMRRVVELAAAERLFGVDDAPLEVVADPDPYLGAVRDLVTGPDSAARRVATAPFDAVPFHLTYKCDGCIYNEFCMKWCAERDDLSLLPHLSAGDKGALQRAGIATVRDLALLKAPTAAGSPDLAATPGQEALAGDLAATWPVGPHLDELIHRARYVRRRAGEPLAALSYIPSKGYSSLPHCAPDHNPNLVRVYIDAQHDYLHDRIYLLGALVSAAENGVESPERRRTIVHLSDGPPDSAAREEALFVHWIDDTLRAIIELAAPDERGQPRAPIHLIFFNQFGQRLLLDGLARHFTTILGATPLYDFLTQLAAFDSPIATFLEREIKERKVYPMVCQSLQEVATFLGFDWGAYRDIFRARLFDSRRKRDREDGEGTWYTGRARFNSQLPLEYAYAAWRDLLPADDLGPREDGGAYAGATVELLQGFQARRLEALERIARDFKGNEQTQKRPFDLPDLASFAEKARSPAGALDEFVTIERHVELADWKTARLAPPEQRMLAGQTLVVRYLEEDQEPNVAARNRENEQRRVLNEEHRAAYRAANPHAKHVRLPKEQREESSWSQDGMRFRLRLEPAEAGCTPERALALSTLREGSRLVIAPRWDVDSRLPAAEQVPYAPTAKQLLYAQRADLASIEPLRDPKGHVTGALIDVVLYNIGANDGGRGFVFGPMASLTRPLVPGAVYTLDEDPNSWTGYWAKLVTEGLAAGEPNALYDRLADPSRIGVDWPEAAAEGQALFLAGLDALSSAGEALGFEPGKRAYIGEHGGDRTLLVQGPPGTGKSYSTAFALFARLQGALAAGHPCRALVSCKTHAATDVLLGKIADVQRMLRDWRERHPAIFAAHFDPQLPELTLFRMQPQGALPAGVTPLRKDGDRGPGEPQAMAAIVAAPVCVVGAVPGGIYRLIKDRWPRESLFGHAFCDLLVLDEASQLNLPEAALAALPLKPDGRLIVVGDHRQMPPIVKHDWTNEPRRTFREYRSYESLFLTLLAQDPPPPMIKFEESFRLHADMAEFLRREVYQQDGIDYRSRRRDTLAPVPIDDPFVASVLDPEQTIVVVTHDEHNSQLQNPFEQALIAPILVVLADARGYGLTPRDGLGVVVPHRAQRAALQTELPCLSERDDDGKVTLSAVDTVERFQGDERTAILVSATESDREYLLASSRFLLDPRRLTVALSRAKRKMILVASRSVFELFSADEETFAHAQLWKNLLRRTCTTKLWEGEREGRRVTVWGNVPSGTPPGDEGGGNDERLPAAVTDSRGNAGVTAKGSADLVATDGQEGGIGMERPAPVTKNGGGNGAMAGTATGDLVEGNLVTDARLPHLGVGTVQRLAGDRADVRFYKGGDGAGTIERCDAASLMRFRYDGNAMIFSRTEGAFGIVLGMRETDGLLTYQVQFGVRRKRIPESDILPVPPVGDPFDLLREGQLEDAGPFILALQARRLQYAYSYDELVSLSNARIELLPHQVFVAHRVLASYPRNFLLADEVGLGKTIEAGLVIKELRARDAARRVLVVAPAGLVPQWVDELQKKFNERFTRLDSITLAAHVAMHGAEGAWEAYDNVVTSLHLLRSNEAHVEALARQSWDLVIFDEAHHLRRYLDNGRREEGRNTTGAYRLAERLTASATTTLLLTAPPLQLHAYELYSLIELLDPTLFPSFADFERYRRQIPTLNDIVQRLERYDTLPASEREELAGWIVEALREEHRASALTVAGVRAELEDSAGMRARYAEEIGNAHRLTAVMLRNRKRQVFDDLQPRRARVLTVRFSEAERIAYDAVTAYIEEAFNLARATGNEALGFVMVTYRKILTSSSYALRQSFERRIVRLLALRNANALLRRRIAGEALDEAEAEELEQMLERHADAVHDVSPQGLATEVARLRTLCGHLDAIAIDTKAERLLVEVRRLLADPAEKVLIFSQFKQTVLYLQRLLEPHYRVKTFYGEMDAAEKDEVVDAFRDSGGAQILIATEAAGEGRNLQFCHIMFNYDLPWNPMKIEQRIGRLDRIGQDRPVEIYNFAIEDTLEDRVLQVLHDRIQIFETTVGNLDPIIGNLERDVRDLLLGRGGDTAGQLRAFEQDIDRRVREAREMEAKLTDFILDARSFRRDRADALLGRQPAFTTADLREFMARFLAQAGGQMREQAAGVYDLYPPRGLPAPAGRELKDAYRATFDPTLAQRQERLDFVAFGHELLDSAVAHCLDDEFGGKSAALTIETDRTPPGEALCAVYEFSFDGIRKRKELRAIAVSPDGTPLPALSEQFPALVLHALEAGTVPAAFGASGALDSVLEAIEDAASGQLERERRRQNERNLQDYGQERQKLDRFYAAKGASAAREVRRLEELLRQQRASGDANMQRIVPATQGRLAAAERHAEDLERERQRRLGELDRRQTVTSSSQLLGAAFVTVRAPAAQVA